MMSRIFDTWQQDHEFVAVTYGYSPFEHAYKVHMCLLDSMLDLSYMLSREEVENLMTDKNNDILLIELLDRMYNELKERRDKQLDIEIRAIKKWMEEYQ